MTQQSSSEVVATAFWRRLDTTGHDACRLLRHPAGWQLEGAVVFRTEEGVPAHLAYSVDCDARWRTRWGRVVGWCGQRDVDYRVERAPAGTWTLNGAPVPGLEAYVDLDLAITPATNLQQLRRVPLAVGAATELPVAWLDVTAGTLAALPQRYARRTELTYWYEAPSVGYAGVLELDPTGFVRRYPGLWAADE